MVAATADGEGDFWLHAPSPGSYFVYASSLGYMEVVDGVLEPGEASNGVRRFARATGVIT